MYLYLGLGIGLILAAALIIGLAAYKFSLNRKTETIWANRREQIAANTAAFDQQLKANNFTADSKISIRAYNRGTEKKDIFRFYIDATKEMIAISSFEEDPMKVEFIEFDEILSFGVINGISNTTSQSFTSGAAAGAYGVGGGIASTDTYQETTIEKIKLKIDFKSKFKNPLIVMLFRYRVDNTSELYSELIDSIENIKAILSKIIQNKENS